MYSDDSSCEMLGALMPVPVFSVSWCRRTLPWTTDRCRYAATERRGVTARLEDRIVVVGDAGVHEYPMQRRARFGEHAAVVFASSPRARRPRMAVEPSSCSRRRAAGQVHAGSTGGPSSVRMIPRRRRAGVVGLRIDAAVIENRLTRRRVAVRAAERDARCRDKFGKPESNGSNSWPGRRWG